MGVNRRPVQRLHKLRDDVTENVPGREKSEQRDKKLNSSPGAYNVIRGIRRRQASDFGVDSLDRKLEAAWEANVNVERFDFDPGAGTDFGIRVQLSESAQGSARGIKAGDELQISQKDSALAAQKFEAVEEANSGDVASGKARIVDSLTWRLPDDAGWSDELGVQIRVELGAGKR